MWKKSSFSGRTEYCVEVCGQWTKSSLSTANGQCVELAPGTERKSSYSNSAHMNCVTAGSCMGHTHTLVRDSKLGDSSPILEFTAPEFRSFLQQVKQGMYDL